MLVSRCLNETLTDSDSDGRASPLSRRLSILHLVASAGVLLLLVLGLLWLAREHDHLAAYKTRQMVEHKIASFEEQFELTNRDFSVWTEAYEAILKQDRPWLYSNIGSGAADIGALDLIALVPPDAQVFGWHEGSLAEGEGGLLPDAVVTAMLARLQGTSVNDHAVRSAYAELDGEVWLLTVTRVVPVQGLPAGTADADVPRQIQGVRIRERLLADIERSFLLEGVDYGSLETAGKAGYALPFLAGPSETGILWSVPRPGTQILERLAVPLSLSITVFVMLVTVVSRRMARSAGHLEKALATARAAERAKSEFLANVSHDLRTPMNGIMGIAQILATTRLETRQHQLLETLLDCGRRQMRLIEALLDSARLASGRRELITEPFRPGAVLDDIARIAREQCASKGLDFTYVDETRNETLMGDVQAVQTIASNLIDNAIKFTMTGGVSMLVRTRPVGEDVELRIAVRDTGIGIDPADQGRIFERLTQVDASASRANDGLGLGLSICRSLVELMGGRLLVESAPGQGSTFTFSVVLPSAPEHLQVAS